MASQFDGTGLAQLTRSTGPNATNLFAHWSADGSQIFFYSTRSLDGIDSKPASTGNLWRMNVDGTGMVPLTTDTAFAAGPGDAQWSPDGKQIVVDSFRGMDGSAPVPTPLVSNLWRMSAEGGMLFPLGIIRNADSDTPQWSPTGTEIFYRSSRNVDGTDSLNPNRTVNVWRLKADGTDLIPLTRATAAGADALHPEWSADGSEIVFESSRSIDGTDTVSTPLTTNIWRVKADGTGLVPLTSGDPNSSGVGNLGFFSFDDFRLTRKMWSPGGTRLIFLSNRDVNGAGTKRNSPYNIWRVNPDGSGLAPVTRMTAIDTDARFLHARP